MTDAWVSMGENNSKKKYFKNYQVNKDVMKITSKEAFGIYALPSST